MEVNNKKQIHSQEGNVCCGTHEICETDLLKASVNNDIEYYDDEELDAYRGKNSEEYEENEIEEFREVLCTMQTNEVKYWLRSLQLRGIELPDKLKDEAFTFIN